MSPSTEKAPRRLQYYMHDDPDAFRLELAGALAGPFAETVYHAWRTALSTLGSRRAIVDISFLEGIDHAGREALWLWHRHGAHIVARSPESRAFAQGIPLEPSSLSAVGEGLAPRLRRAIQRLLRVLRAVSGGHKNNACGNEQKRKREGSDVNHGGLPFYADAARGSEIAPSCCSKEALSA
jgi:hypothetical protein